MKYYLLPLLFLANLASLVAQDVRPLKGISADKTKQQTQVIPLYTDADVSSYIIFVKDKVNLHVHAEHTEQVIVLEGKGVMTLGSETIPIRKGDYIMIPKGVQHSVRVKGRKLLKVLSIQAPEFKGKDRIFIE